MPIFVLFICASLDSPLSLSTMNASALSATSFLISRNARNSKWTKLTSVLPAFALPALVVLLSTVPVLVSSWLVYDLPLPRLLFLQQFSLPRHLPLKMWSVKKLMKILLRSWFVRNLSKMKPSFVPSASALLASVPSLLTVSAPAHASVSHHRRHQPPSNALRPPTKTTKTARPLAIQDTPENSSANFADAFPPATTM